MRNIKENKNYFKRIQSYNLKLKKKTLIISLKRKSPTEKKLIFLTHFIVLQYNKNLTSVLGQSNNLYFVACPWY